jgi:rhodanese-related sulfurtransferase
MKKKLLLSVSIILCVTIYLFPINGHPNADSHVSGELINGYRILPIENTAGEIELNVFRGDYIKFKFNDAVIDPFLSIPDLSIRQKITGDPNSAPYFKMKETGVFRFSLGTLNGNITVTEYQKVNYKAVSSQEAMALIKDVNPVILDVRTPREFKKGHLKNAILIPVQQLQQSLNKIAIYKNRDILIYCATGNRSTVAAKMLIDNGFKRIFNLRYGIYEWKKRKYPIVN